MCGDLWPRGRKWDLCTNAKVGNCRLPPADAVYLVSLPSSEQIWLGKGSSLRKSLIISDMRIMMFPGAEKEQKKYWWNFQAPKCISPLLFSQKVFCQVCVSQCWEERKFWRFLAPSGFLFLHIYIYIFGGTIIQNVGPVF